MMLRSGGIFFPVQSLLPSVMRARSILYITAGTAPAMREGFVTEVFAIISLWCFTIMLPIMSFS